MASCRRQIDAKLSDRGGFNGLWGKGIVQARDSSNMTSIGLPFGEREPQASISIATFQAGLSALDGLSRS